MTTAAKKVEPVKDDIDSYAAPENRAKTPWAVWEDKETKKPFIGRQYSGVLVERKIVPNTLKLATNPTATQKSAIQSLTLRSAAAMAIAAVASRFSVDLPTDSAQEVAGALIDLVTTLGLVGVAIGRTRARGPIV